MRSPGKHGRGSKARLRRGGRPAGDQVESQGSVLVQKAERGLPEGRVSVTATAREAGRQGQKWSTGSGSVEVTGDNDKAISAERWA